MVDVYNICLRSILFLYPLCVYFTTIKCTSVVYLEMLNFKKIEIIIRKIKQFIYEGDIKGFFL